MSTHATQDDDRAATHLSRLGVNPVVVARLRQYAESDGERLRDLVRYVLSDYAPGSDARPEDEA